MSPHVATNSSVTMSSTLTMSRSGTMNNQVTMRRNGAMSRRVGIATIALALASGLTAALSILWRGDLATTTVITPRGELVELVTTGVYAHNSLPVVAEGLGWDLVTLVLAAPALLGCSLIAMRGSRRALYASLGLVTYLFYQYLMYATYWAFGPMFLIHVALYATAHVSLLAPEPEPVPEPEPGQAGGVQPRPAAQIEDARRPLTQQTVDKAHMPVDLLEAPAGRIVILRKVLGQHAGRKARLVPGDVVALRPGLGGGNA